MRQLKGFFIEVAGSLAGGTSGSSIGIGMGTGMSGSVGGVASREAEGTGTSPGSVSADEVYRGRSWSMCWRQTGPRGTTHMLTVRVPNSFVTTAGTHRGSLFRLAPRYRA